MSDDEVNALAITGIISMEGINDHYISIVFLFISVHPVHGKDNNDNETTEYSSSQTINILWIISGLTLILILLLIIYCWNKYQYKRNKCMELDIATRFGDLSKLSTISK